MKRRYLAGLAVILIIALFGLVLTNKLGKRTLNYIDAIDETYNRNIDSMSVVACKTSNLYFNNDIYVLSSGSGNRGDNFSADSEEGIMLWETRQLFLSIKDLKVLREGLPQILEPHKGRYYIIQTVQDFQGSKSTGKVIGKNSLTVFINAENYHVYMPKNHDESNELLMNPTVYIEYEPNEITKKLIKDIVEQ